MTSKYAILIDLSGTLFIDNVATPGAVEILKKLLKNENFAVKFVTNTTKESTNNLMLSLKNLGFDYIKKEQLFTSLTSAKKLILENNLKPILFLESEAMEDFENILISTIKPNCVVIGLAPNEFYYEKLNDAFRFLHQNENSILIGIHQGRYYARKDGLALGPGPFVKALEYATGKKAIIVGKPEKHFYLNALKTLGNEFLPQNVVMIGDDVQDDINGSLALGFKAILVQTGKYCPKDEEKVENHHENFKLKSSVTEALKEIFENDGKNFF